MPACPLCKDGYVDGRDMDAWLQEHLTAEEIERREINVHVGIYVCDECEGTGIVSLIRHRLLHAAWAALMEQELAARQDARLP